MLIEDGVYYIQGPAEIPGDLAKQLLVEPLA